MATAFSEAVTNEVITRVKQEIAAFGLATREQCRQQLDAERYERIAGVEECRRQCEALLANAGEELLKECREECTSLRDDARNFQTRLDKVSNSVVQQRRDMESQMQMLKDYVRDTASVSSDMADRLLNLPVVCNESQRLSYTGSSSKGLQPQDSELLWTELMAEREKRESFAAGFTRLLEDQAQHFDDLLAQGVTQGCTQAFIKDAVGKDMDRLLMKVNTIERVAFDAVTADVLESKVYEIFGPIQASMVSVTNELQAVIATVGMSKGSSRCESQEGTALPCDSELTISQDGTDADSNALSYDQVRQLHEHIKLLGQMIPDGQKLKQLDLKVEEVTNNVSELQNLSGVQAELSNSLLKSFEAFREEIHRRINSMETSQKRHEGEPMAKMRDDVTLWMPNSGTSARAGRSSVPQSAADSSSIRQGSPRPAQRVLSPFSQRASFPGAQAKPAGRPNFTSRQSLQGVSPGGCSTSFSLASVSTSPGMARHPSPFATYKSLTSGGSSAVTAPAASSPAASAGSPSLSTRCLGNGRPEASASSASGSMLLAAGSAKLPCRSPAPAPLFRLNRQQSLGSQPTPLSPSAIAPRGSARKL